MLYFTWYSIYTLQQLLVLRTEKFVKVGKTLPFFFQVLLICLAAAAANAAPQLRRFYRPDGRHYAILSQGMEGPDGARFRYHYRTENGINVEAQGTPGSKGQSNIAGGFR